MYSYMSVLIKTTFFYYDFGSPNYNLVIKRGWLDNK